MMVGVTSALGRSCSITPIQRQGTREVETPDTGDHVGTATREAAWPSGKAGSIPLRLSLFFKSCGLWTLFCDSVPHN